MEKREKYGFTSGLAGTILNLGLFATKLAAGILSGAVSVVADALNNLSDVSASLVTMLGFKISAKKADDEHPFGHGRMEYISGLIVSILIIIFGIELFKSSVQAVINPRQIHVSHLTLSVLAFSILVKLFMFAYNLKLSKKINSAALKANAKDSISDVISTSVVLAAIAFSAAYPESKIQFDGIAGIVVALFVLWNGISSAKDTINPLLGVPAESHMVKAVEEVAMGFHPICGIHDILIHEYGPGRIMISLHAEVPGNRDIYELHQAIDDAESALGKKFNCDAVIHMDPVDFSNYEVMWLKAYLKKAAEEIDRNLSVHDVRLVPCDNRRYTVRFDALRPRGFKMTDAELIQKLSSKVKEFKPEYKCEIQIDTAF